MDPLRPEAVQSGFARSCLKWPIFNSISDFLWLTRSLQPSPLYSIGLELFTVYPGSTLSSRWLSQPRTTLSSQLHIDATRTNIDCSSIGRIEIWRWSLPLTTYWIIWKRKIGLGFVDSLLFGVVLSDDLLVRISSRLPY